MAHGIRFLEKQAEQLKDANYLLRLKLKRMETEKAELLAALKVVRGYINPAMACQDCKDADGSCVDRCVSWGDIQKDLEFIDAVITKAEGK